MASSVQGSFGYNSEISMLLQPWIERPHEERYLLNPGFCAFIIWHSATGALQNPKGKRTSLNYLETFLLLPLILHKKTRESIPTNVRTSIPIWVEGNPLLVAGLPVRTKQLVPYVREAIIYGSNSNLFRIQGDAIQPNGDYKSVFNRAKGNMSDEVIECMKKAEFLGRWFMRAGSVETTYALLGIRP